MQSKQFKLVEKNLYKFYEEQIKITSLERELRIIRDQYDEIERKLKGNEFTIEEQSSSWDFEERVQSSSDGTSYVEKQIIKRAELLIKEQQFLLNREYEKEARLRTLIRNREALEYNIEMLSEEYKRFIILKYKEKRSIVEIKDILNMSKTSAYNLREKIIEEVSRWEYIITELNYRT